MPPYFLYILALMAYLSVACVVWVMSIILALSARTRPLAKKIAAGMAGSFPGVFMFQIIAAPFVALILLPVIGVLQFFHPPDFVVVFVSIPFVVFLISIPLIASLLGFYTGWRLAWELAGGGSVRECLRRDRVLAPMIRFLIRNFPTLEGWL